MNIKEVLETDKNVKTFRNALTGDNKKTIYSSVTHCASVEKPTFGKEQWIECNSSEVLGLNQLYMIAGVRFYGKL